MSQTSKQFLGFAAVGTIALAIDFGLLCFLHEIFGIDPLIAASCSFTIATIFNYIASMQYVYTHRDDISRRREFSIFFALSVIGLIINAICMYIGQLLFEAAHVPYLNTNWYLFVKTVASGVVSTWNFFSRRHWIDGGQVDDVLEEILEDIV